MMPIPDPSQGLEKKDLILRNETRFYLNSIFFSLYFNELY